MESDLHELNSTIQGGTEKLALVDDETALTDIMQTILTNIGYRVRVFTDSQEALAAITDNPDDFDLIITDYSMPKITGIEIAKRIKQASHRGISARRWKGPPRKPGYPR